jgi:hypothetical protein
MEDSSKFPRKRLLPTHAGSKWCQALRRSGPALENLVKEGGLGWGPRARGQERMVRYPKYKAGSCLSPMEENTQIFLKVWSSNSGDDYGSGRHHPAKI